MEHDAVVEGVNHPRDLLAGLVALAQHGHGVPRRGAGPVPARRRAVPGDLLDRELDSRSPVADEPTVGVPGLPTTVVLAISATATVVLGILPGAVLDLAGQAARFVG